MNRLISCGLLAFCIVLASSAQPQSLITNWTFNPAPENGSYEPGTTVEICVDVAVTSLPNGEWPWGFELILPEGWNTESITNIVPPISCSGNGGGTGEWIYFNSLSCSNFNYGPGFYYDVNVAGPQDGNPCNNWGDPCFGDDYNWTLCFTIDLVDVCEAGSSDLDITPNLRVIDDNSVDWLPDNCTSCIDGPEMDIELNCCNIGTSFIDDVYYVCGNSTIDLVNLLSSPNPMPSGVFFGPSGSTAGNFFIPGISPFGTYSYAAIGEFGCSEIISIDILDGDTDYGIIEFDLCTSQGICFDEVAAVLEIEGDLTFYYPDLNGELSMAEEVVSGCIDPEADPEGVYAFSYTDENGCTMSGGVDLSFDLIEAEDETIEFCVDEGTICLGDFFMDEAAYILFDDSGTFVEYYLEAPCLSAAELEGIASADGVVNLNRIISSSFCDAATVNLQIQLQEGSECGGSAQLIGTLNWNENCGEETVMVTLIDAGSNQEIASGTGTIQTDGSFAISNLPIGNYDVVLEIPGYLNTGTENLTLNEGENTVSLPELINGNINNDGVVNITDVSLLNASFGAAPDSPTFNSNADLNCDGSVNVIDVSILNLGFGMTGFQ